MATMQGKTPRASATLQLCKETTTKRHYKEELYYEEVLKDTEALEHVKRRATCKEGASTVQSGEEEAVGDPYQSLQQLEKRW